MNDNDKVNILMVDDQPAKLMSYEAVLADLNENLIKAETAGDALQTLLKLDVAVVLLDVCLPDINGFELAEMIRKHPRCEKTSIILVSAVYLSDFDRLRGYGCGAVDYVPVPIVPELLRAKVSVFAELYRKSEQLSKLNLELERRVSERTAALEASTANLRVSEGKFRRTFECNMIPMGVWGPAGTVTEANDALLKLIDRSREDVAAGRIHWRDISPPCDRAHDNAFFDDIAVRGVGSAYEKEFLDSDGRHIPILCGGASFEHPADGGVFFAVDLSQQRAAEAERAQLLESEQLARTAAEAANRLKDEFLATLSHELRTPISAVLGWVQLLKRGSVDAATLDEGLRVIESGVKTQVRLIDELLDVNRIASGKLRIGNEAVDLARVLGAAVETIKPDTDAKEISIRQMGDPAGICLQGDATRLQQVFWNLLANAKKFTPRGGRIEARVECAGPHVQVTIADTGQGIKPEFLPHVFERFRQADSTTTRDHGGLGLGLAIAKHLVELHGGSIRAESDGIGLGARFIVTLPLAKVHVEADASRSNRHLPPNELDGIRVLIVDDDQAGREIVARTLAEYAATARAVASAEVALEVFEDWCPDVLVCDIAMPQKDGYSLMREIRTLQSGGNIPSIALTAHTRGIDRTRALSAGFNAYLQKPIDMQELVLTISRLARPIAYRSA